MTRVTRKRRVSGLSRLDRLGIALIAVALALGLLWRLGSLDLATVEQLRDLRSSLEATATAPVEPDAGQPLEEAPTPSAPGLLGEPPSPRLRYPHLRPTDEPDLERVTHRFQFEGTTHEVSVDVDMGLYGEAADADRLISQRPGETEQERWTDYYRYMVQDREQAPLISAVAKRLHAIAERERLDRDRYAEFIAKYVQTMPYDYEKLQLANPQARFPVQTIVDGTGVCGDKSLLMAALLAHEGYEVSLLLFDAERHMAVGIKGPGNEYKGSGYLFVESTSPTYLSEIPESFVSGIRLTSDPHVIPLGEGDQGYSSADEVDRILRVRNSAQEAQQELYRDASAKQLTAEQASDVNARLEIAYESQFKLTVIDGREQEFLDRLPALSWIDKNCWWD